MIKIVDVPQQIKDGIISEDDMYRTREIDSNVRNNVCKYLKRFVNLRKLELCNKCISSIPEEISNLTYLEYVDFKHNKIGGISKTIKCLHNLKYLDLHDNKIPCISKWTWYLTKLEYLDLSKNNISYVPREIIKLKNLEHLDLGKNQINTFPSFLCELTKLEHLDLSENNISYVPREIIKLKNLEHLDLGKNQINTFPSFLCELQKLKKLNLSYNYLSQINGIENSIELELLDLSYNSIADIPDEFANLIQLHELNLEQNYRPIPNIHNLLGGMLQMRKLNLGYISLNDITFIAGMPLIEELKLRGNVIEDIPEFIEDLQHLRHLDLRNNRLILNDILEEFLERIIQRMEILLEGNLYPHQEDIIPLYLLNVLNQQNINNNIYNDEQNVHSHSIQLFVRISIINLLKDKCYTSGFIKEIIGSDLLTKKTKRLILSFCGSDEIDIEYGTKVNYFTLLKYVWNRIIIHKEKNELLEIFEEEIKSSEYVCFIGKISRLLNVLNGYYDDITIQISEQEHIGSIIGTIRNKYFKNYGEDADLEPLKEKIRRELEERSYNEELINEWVEYV